MKNRRNIIGRDSDDGAWIGAIIGFMIVLFVIMCAIFIMCSIGVLIGAFNSIKNYFASLKANVIDSNRKVRA